MPPAVDGGTAPGSVRGDNADVDGNGLNRMGHLDPAHDGLKFDTNLVADFFLTFNNYTEVLDFGPGYGYREIWRGQLFYATLPTDGGGTATLLGLAADGFPGSYPDEFAFTNGVRLGFRNSNPGGVTSKDDASPSVSDATNVTTGLELAIRITLLDGPNGGLNAEFRIIAFINSSDHGYLSNQTLGPMSQPPGGYGNLEEPRVFDFSAVYSPGEQFFTVANPYPSSRWMLPVTVDAAGASNRWISEVGEEYVLRATDDLRSGIWTNIGSVVTAKTATLSIVDPDAAAATSRFYRAVRLPD